MILCYCGPVEEIENRRDALASASPVPDQYLSAEGCEHGRQIKFRKKEETRTMR